MKFFFQEVAFWLRVCVGILFPVASRSLSKVHFLGEFPDQPEDEPSQQALTFITQGLCPYRRGSFQAVLHLPAGISVAEVQGAFDQLLQKGGFWDYPHIRCQQRVYFVPSPSQWQQLQKANIRLEDICLEQCWDQGRVVIFPWIFNQLLAEWLENPESFQTDFLTRKQREGATPIFAKRANFSS